MLHERDKGIALALNIKGLTLLTQIPHVDYEDAGVINKADARVLHKM